MCCPSPIFKPGNLRCVKAWFHVFSVKSDQESSRRPNKGIAVYVKFSVPPLLVIRQVKKKAVKLPSHRFLPTPNISLSPSSLHFRPDFSLLSTFYSSILVCSSPLHSSALETNKNKKVTWTEFYCDFWFCNDDSLKNLKAKNLIFVVFLWR